MYRGKDVHVCILIDFPKYTKCIPMCIYIYIYIYIYMYIYR